MEDREGGDTYVVIAMATMSFLPSLCAGDVRGMMSDVERRAGASDETHHRLHDRSAFGTYRSAYTRALGWRLLGFAQRSN